MRRTFIREVGDLGKRRLEISKKRNASPGHLGEALAYGRR